MLVAEPSDRLAHQGPTIRGLSPQAHMAPAERPRPLSGSVGHFRVDIG